MCGIAGYIDSQGEAPDEALVARMSEILRHRGPDAGKVQTVATGKEGPTVVFGHRRLSIIDLSQAASQPLGNEDGSVVVTYNGEIYNFRQLRRELAAHGHTFRSSSDTEVIVHAYESFGDDFVSHLDGMFAFALWDARGRRLVLARDRMGKKPLYYAEHGRRLAFASEIKCLRLCDWVDASVAWDQLPALLGLGYAPWPHTMFAGIRQVPPSSCMVFEDGRLSEPRQYWSPRFAGDSGTSIGRRSMRREAESAVRARLTDAVAKRLVSDVPLGVLLSGGLDSSAIVALMHDLGVPARTFTVGIAEEASYDERPFARLVAERFGADHTEIEVKADAADLVERLLWFHDQPFGDSSAVPTYLISEAASEFVTVLLVGDGGDEVFGGYERFAAALIADRVPTWIQRSIGTLGSFAPRSESYHGIRRSIDRFAGHPELKVSDRYLGWVCIFDDEALGRILPGGSTAGGGQPFASFDEQYDLSGDVPLLHRLLYANLRTYLHDDLLVKSDRMTMAVSMEARSPLLDTALLEEVAALPAWMKTTPFALKRILRASMKNSLPRQILHRRKHGFGVPVARWFRGELGAAFQELVLAKDARSGDVLDQKEVGLMFDEHAQRRSDHGARLWLLLTLELWLRSLERPIEMVPPSRPKLAITERHR